MWRKAETIEDAVLILQIAEASDKVSYNTSGIKGAIEYKSQELFTLFSDTNEQFWIYEDGEGKGALRLNKRVKPNGIETGRICNFVASGFDPDLFTNWQIAFPILMTKVREVYDEWKITDYMGIIPRTKTGECLAYFCDILCWDSEPVGYMPDMQGFKVDFNRAPEKKPINESTWEPLAESLILPDAKIEMEKI